MQTVRFCLTGVHKLRTQRHNKDLQLSTVRLLKSFKLVKQLASNLANLKECIHSQSVSLSSHTFILGKKIFILLMHFYFVEIQT